MSLVRCAEGRVANAVTESHIGAIATDRMAHLNAGQVPEAAAELKLYHYREPDGRFAEQAAGILAQIQP